jgi:hypothetical protein
MENGLSRPFPSVFIIARARGAESRGEADSRERKKVLPSFCLHFILLLEDQWHYILGRGGGGGG